MKLHLINLCLQARIDFYNQQKEEQKANRAKYREKVRRQKTDKAFRKNLGKKNTGKKLKTLDKTPRWRSGPNKNSKILKRLDVSILKSLPKCPQHRHHEVVISRSNGQT